MNRLLIVALSCALGCAWGGVDKDGAWGSAFGNAKVTNCITETSLNRVEKLTADGVQESSENRISKITENCYTIAGGPVSDQGAGLVQAVMSPLRMIGRIIMGAGSAN